ncbi:tRNA (adenosine(37)-N6)-threonylcarbamoyltransferase complex transferase subunit TsaD [Candidatus Uhrbacteria bacterium]|nr:tRNA (adenosine(37)-N6)-threonylcarbamoyltransferase complex transferase subunit TsaD [Candidatus Uhrbacteria bacterium]
MKRMRILAIETSCDETAVSIVHFCGEKMIRVVKNLVFSQIPIHQKYGGVVPEVAARSHVAETVSLLTQATGKQQLKSFDAIAVTQGPGLATALRVGIEAARTLTFLSGKPLIGVNHLEGHLASAWLNAQNREKFKFPLLALIVSGGHTELVLMKDFCKYKIVGQTRDDAAGECFDKSAKLMGLPYPGGPHIAQLALDGDPHAFDLPHPMLKDPSLDFSFSGLKTAVRQSWEKLEIKNKKIRKNFAASLQQTIVDVLVEKTIRAAKKFKVNGILLVGGVSANQELRRQMGERIECELKKVTFLPSDRLYITDNAAMIAAAGFWRLRNGDRTNWKTIDAKPEWNV